MTTSSSVHEEAQLNRMKCLVEKLRLENAALKKDLQTERCSVRTLKAQHDTTMRQLKCEHRKREESLEMQLRSNSKDRSSKIDDSTSMDVKKLQKQLDAFKVVNKQIQDKLKVANTSERELAIALRSLDERYAMLLRSEDKSARVQIVQLLEEIKSKDRMIDKLSSNATSSESNKVHIMDGGTKEMHRKMPERCGSRGADNIKHRKEAFYRDNISEVDSAISSEPTSLSPQPHNDTWGCSQCAAACSRAASSAAECSKLSDALRDAREQLELLEFRVLELEDAASDKGIRESDSDSGCVSPGSRIKDSASPELRRMDSGYKSPNSTSPCSVRRKDSINHTSDLNNMTVKNTSESLSDNLEADALHLRENLERMILNCGSNVEQRCLEHVLMLLENLHNLSAFNEDDFQAKPKQFETKSDKLVLAVTPYSQNTKSKQSSELKRMNNSTLQESGIFDEIETENKETQTDSYVKVDISNEIQRLNNITDKKDNVKIIDDKYECNCPKLGKRDKHFYERRLKFLEGKISIYEAAQDVREAKLAQRLQKEFVLESKVQELESQLALLQDKYDHLEEECCELEELENDTRLHSQQLELECEVAQAALRDMTDARECSQSLADRLAREIELRDEILRNREAELLKRLEAIEEAVPAIILWNVTKVIALMKTSERVPAKLTFKEGDESMAIVTWSERVTNQDKDKMKTLQQEKRRLQGHVEELRQQYDDKIKKMEGEKRAETKLAFYKMNECNKRLGELDIEFDREKRIEKHPNNDQLNVKISTLTKKEQELKNKVKEIEKREAAYLKMLTQADEMWAEMEAGYKKKIVAAHSEQAKLKEKIRILQTENERKRSCCEPLKQKLREITESEANLKLKQEKNERDIKNLVAQKKQLIMQTSQMESKLMESQLSVQELKKNYKSEIEELRQKMKSVAEDLRTNNQTSEKIRVEITNDFEKTKKELARSNKNCQDLEVTNSELREEVEALENQVEILQKSLIQCKRKCDDKMKSISMELTQKTEELEEVRSEILLSKKRMSSKDQYKDDTIYGDNFTYTVSNTIPKRDYRCGRMCNSLNFIESQLTGDKCQCPNIRSQLIGTLIEDLFDRMKDVDDVDLGKLCMELPNDIQDIDESCKAKIRNYLLMAISKELVRSIGDADAKTETKEWQSSVRRMQNEGSSYVVAGGVWNGARRMASVAAACAAARLCTTRPLLGSAVNAAQQEVLENSDVKIMEDQLAHAIESIVNCPSCALGHNSIIWSTDV